MDACYIIATEISYLSAVIANARYILSPNAYSYQQTVENCLNSIEQEIFYSSVLRENLKFSKIITLREVKLRQEFYKKCEELLDIKKKIKVKLLFMSKES